MNFFKKRENLKWVSLIAWVVIIVILSLVSPSLNKLVAEKGAITLPSNYPTEVIKQLAIENQQSAAANTISNQSSRNTLSNLSASNNSNAHHKSSDSKVSHSSNTSIDNTYTNNKTTNKSQSSNNSTGLNSNQYIAVFNVPTGLTESDVKNIGNTLNNVSKNKSKLHISSITDCFSNTALKGQMISKNNKTILAIFNINPNGMKKSVVRKEINDSIKTPGIQTYLTGNSLIESDINIASQKGLARIAVITVVFILIVLFLVFRSFIIPFIPLLTIIISFEVSQFIIAILSNSFNFPVSNYTQVFMISILFGIGTDYSILLISRFREELDNGINKYEAIKITYRTAGRTVLFSAIPVFVVFALLYFVDFSLYRSASAVSISIIILILALFTLLPSAMAILGDKMFWPFNKKQKHKENKFWTILGKFALNRSILALIVVGIVCIPPICLNNGVESFNLVNEISSKYQSIEGFNIIAKNFGTGKISPVTIYIANDTSMKSPQYIETIAKISDNISKAPGIQSVMSISQPLGTRLSDIYVNTQAGMVNKGLDTGTKDLDKIGDSLSSTSKSLKNSEPQLANAVNNVSKLNTGTLATKKGVEQLQSALNELSNSINIEANATNKLKNGVESAEGNLNKLKSGQQKIQHGYKEVGQNLNLISNKVNSATNKADVIAEEANQLTNSVDTSKLNNISNAISSNLQAYIKENPSALKNKNFMEAVNDLNNLSSVANKDQSQLIGAIKTETQNSINELNTLNSGLKELSTAMNELNSKSVLVTNGIGEFQTGIGEVANGLNELNNGLNETNKGGKEIDSKVPEISAALGQISKGQSEIKSGFQEFSGKIKDLSGGLATGASDINKINNGVKEANGYIEEWSKLPYGNTGVYVPESIFNNKEFKEALNNYMSPNGKLTKINVTLSENPYSNKAMNEIPALKNIVASSIRGTNLSNAQVGISGLISIDYQVRAMANHDYYEVMFLVIVGVLITLIILLRSIIMPMYLVGSIILTYFAALGIVQLIFQKVLGYVGLSWIAIFFGFVVLVALGIDYSIFIITRFKQNKGVTVKERMMKTIQVMGGVIMSAALILGGTFMALMPSGVLILGEIAGVVIMGLILYIVIVLPMFIPVMAKMFNETNFWPYDGNGNFILFKKNNKGENEASEKE